MVFITVARLFLCNKSARRGPFQGTEGHVFGFPIDVGGDASIAWVLPVDVPRGIDFEGNTDAKGVTGFYFYCAKNEFGSDAPIVIVRSEEHTSELQSRGHLVCRLLLEKKK